MKRATLLIVLFGLTGSGQLKPKEPIRSRKDCLSYVNTASGMAADYSEQPFSTQRLQALSAMEDKLIECANLPNTSHDLLYSLFDAEVRVSGAKQVWLASH